MSPDQREHTAPAAHKPRIALWDNARFIILVLVVVGHTVSTVRTDSALGYGLYVYIFLFHMPAIFLLSGLFAKPKTSPKAIKSTIQLLVIWGVWEGIWALVHLFAEGEAPGKNFLVSPAWTLWFLVSLATMRIALPFIAKLRRPLLFSIVVALLSGISPAIGSEFSASRTLVFLPFFVAGWLIKERGLLNGLWFQKPTRATYALGWAFLALVAVVLVLLPQLRDEWRVDKWLTWRDDYFWLFEHAQLGDWDPSGWGIALGGIVVALGLLLIAALMTFAGLLVVPRTTIVMTAWGSRTLYIYLLHAPIVWTLRQTGVIDEIASFGAAGLLLLVVLGVGIAIVLSMSWVTRVFWPVIEPRIGVLLQREKP